jgi:predicted PurR-regulated permease PerM
MVALPWRGALLCAERVSNETVMNLPDSLTLRTNRIEVASLVLAGIALLIVLHLGLLAALLAGLLAHQCAYMLASRHRQVGISRFGGKLIALTLLGGLFAVGVTYGTVRIANFVTGSEGIIPLMQEMANAIDTARTHFPPWAQEYLPTNVEELESQAASWLRAHAGTIGNLGETLGKMLVHVLIGLIIGGMIVLADPTQGYSQGKVPGPLARAMETRVTLLGRAFRRVVFGQVRISALNTLLTGIYLAAILPMFGIHLPLVKTMIVVTFIVGLLPVLGNLISNTVIVVVSLSVSLYVAIASLVFLVAIHKLEYFINARIIGGQIRARAWELLLAMLVMEAAFGIPGVIAAPIYYAYVKYELSARGLI